MKYNEFKDRYKYINHALFARCMYSLFEELRFKKFTEGKKSYYFYNGVKFEKSDWTLRSRKNKDTGLYEEIEVPLRRSEYHTKTCHTQNMDVIITNQWVSFLIIDDMLNQYNVEWSVFDKVITENYKNHTTR